MRAMSKCWDYGKSDVIEIDGAAELGPEDRNIADLLAMDRVEEIALEIPVRRELATPANFS
jgi:hypothetical protein